MISASQTGPHSHSHSHSRMDAHALAHPRDPRGGGVAGPLDLDTTGRNRLCMDSQKFLVPSLPVSTRLNNNGAAGNGSVNGSHDASNKKRERSIINGTTDNGGSNGYPYHFNHQQNQNQIANGIKRPFGPGQHENGNHFQGGGLNRGKVSHHPAGSPHKDSVGINPLYYQHNHNHNQSVSHNHANANSELQRAYHQMPTNPSNYHHLSRSSMPVPCSSPAAASSASPKSLSPAVNGIQYSTAGSSSSHSYSSQQQSSIVSHGDLSLTSPLRFYPGAAGLTHPTHHQMSFYAAAAAAAQQLAAAGQHHPGLPYSLFGGTPYGHTAAAASSYLDNFHSSLLAQQQQEHLKAIGQAHAAHAQAHANSPSPSPPSRPTSSGFHSRSPLASPNISAASLHNKFLGGPTQAELGAFGVNATSHGRNNVLQDGDSHRLASMLCSGLSKGGPLGLSHSHNHNQMDNSNSNFHHISSLATNHFSARQKDASVSNGKSFNGVERNSNSISSKFWNIDPSIRGDGSGIDRSKRMASEEPQPPKKHANDPYDMSQSSGKGMTFGNTKDGSLKHRFLTRSPDPVIDSPIKHKMAEPVFTFPTANEREREREREYNYNYQNGNGSFLYPSPKKRSGDPPHPLHYDTLPPTMPMSRPIATTVTTDSAKYLMSQIQKPSINSSITSPPQSSSYLSQNNLGQNLSAHPSLSGFNSFTSPKQPKSVPASPTTPTRAASVASKVSTLPLEQMPVIHAFRKGSMIQLASGQLRPVEELRAEDFHRSAATLVDSLRIIYCNVLSINPSVQQKEEQVYKVTLAVGGAPNHQVVMNTSPVQPLFVVGRGWASCSPDMTEKVLQLACSTLNIGDVCITLTKMCRSKPGRNGVKSGKTTAATGGKNGGTKYNKNGTNSILSTPPRRASATSYASRILKITNGGILKSGNGNLPSPKSPTRVKFEQKEVPPPASFSGSTNGPPVQVTSSMLPPPSPVTPEETTTQAVTVTTATANASTSSTGSPISGSVSGQATTTTTTASSSSDSPTTPNTCPKKRRWSAPDAVEDAEESKEPKQPKRPISHNSPITALP